MHYSENKVYLCTDFLVDSMTIEIGDTSFATLMDGLRQQIQLLKVRCINAETECDRLNAENQEKQSKITELEKENQELNDKYQGLKTGTIQGATVEEVENLRDRYLAMIREIDLCLSKLNG